MRAGAALSIRGGSMHTGINAADGGRGHGVREVRGHLTIDSRADQS